MKQYKLLLQGLVVLLKEELERTKKNKALTKNDFDKGLNMGIYEGLDLIKQQAEAFNIPLTEISLKDYCLEEFL